MINSEMTLKEVFQILETKKVEEIDNYNAWYDWFCSGRALKNRGIALLRKLKSIKKSNKFNKDKTYVFFKNNCPCVGNLYDDFRICDKDTGNVLYTIVPKNSKGEAEVWGRENEFQGPLVKGSWNDVKTFFLS